jgi:hypothetical protein
MNTTTNSSRISTISQTQIIEDEKMEIEEQKIYT